MVELSPAELRRLQMIELEMLIEIDRLCKLHDIDYQIIAGTLLGAVRHGGFIPWDDDADVALLRPEYERFCEACAADLDADRFYFQDIHTTPGYRWGYGKLRRKRTLFLRENQEHMPYDQGVFVDVFPLDSVPATPLTRAVFNFDCYCLRKTLWAPVGEIVGDGSAKRTVYSLANRIPIKHVIRKMDQSIAFGKHIHSPFVRILTFPTANDTYAYVRSWYENSAPVRFEGITFPGTAEADTYLTFKYGNWQELPPEGERKTHPVSSVCLLDDDEYADVLARIEKRRAEDAR